MFQFSSTIVFCFVAVVSGISSPSTRLYYGSNAAYESQFPHMVSLRNENNTHFCGGSIINTKWIITAAQCTRIVTYLNFEIVVGTIKLNSGGTRYQPFHIIPHPSFNQITLANDIAVVSTLNSIELSTFVYPMPLRSSIIGALKPFTITGWGQVSGTITKPNVLQYTIVQTITNDACKNAHLGFDKNRILNSSICATSSNNYAVACYGDIGNPLFDENMNLIGLVSWFIPCDTKFPDVFTRISYYYNWIIENTGPQIN